MLPRSSESLTLLLLQSRSPVRSSVLSTSTSISSVGRTRQSVVKACFGRAKRLGGRAAPGPRGLTAAGQGACPRRPRPSTSPSHGGSQLPLGSASGRRRGAGEGPEDAGSGGLTPVGVGALRGDGGAGAVRPYPLDAQLLQLPLQVSLLSLKLVYLVNGFSVTVFKFLQVKGVVVEGHRRISKLVMTLHLPALRGNTAVFLRSHWLCPLSSFSQGQGAAWPVTPVYI